MFVRAGGAGGRRSKKRREGDGEPGPSTSQRRKIPLRLGQAPAWCQSVPDGAVDRHKLAFVTTGDICLTCRWQIPGIVRSSAMTEKLPR